MTSIAVIGAGPSGLVTAKTLLLSYPSRSFRVTVFEKSSRVGGLWATSSNGIINPEMRTNLSKYTVAFSDLSWESVGFGEEYESSSCISGKWRSRPAPMFPKACQVDRYLQKYCDRYLPTGTISLNTEVLRAELIEDTDGTRWNLVVEDRNSQPTCVSQKTYDYLIVASGFFSGPRDLDFQLPLNMNSRVDSMPKIMHSSCFRQLSDLWHGGRSHKSGKILVIGGSHSGAEIAALIALHTSNNKHSPSQQNTGALEIVHVVQRPLYSLPPFVSNGTEDKNFVPVDLALYDASKRLQDPIKFSYGKLDREREIARRKRMEYLMYGTALDQELEKELMDVDPPQVTIVESYTEFIKSGAIKPVLGRVESLKEQQPKDNQRYLSAKVACPDKDIQINDISAVVYATGFSASPALDFLSKDVKSRLDFDPNCPRIPLLLDENFISSSSKLPSLAFIGFTDAPYWGGMEMQARLIARKWAAEQAPGQSDGASLSAGHAPDLESLRKAMLEEKSSVPQNWFSDYVGLMEEAARELRLERLDGEWKEGEGFICPARYLDAGTDREQARATMEDIRRTLGECQREDKYVPRAVFRGIHGRWKAAHGRGDSMVEVVVDFHPRWPTDGAYDLEYLCYESCTHSTQDSSSPGGERRYVYRYSEVSDQISVWSVREDNNKAADKMLYYLGFTRLVDADRPAAWSVQAKYPGDPDLAHTVREVQFAGVEVGGLSIEVMWDSIGRCQRLVFRRG